MEEVWTRLQPTGILHQKIVRLSSTLVNSGKQKLWPIENVVKVSRSYKHQKFVRLTNTIVNSGKLELQPIKHFVKVLRSSKYQEIVWQIHQLIQVNASSDPQNIFAKVQQSYRCQKIVRLTSTLYLKLTQVKTDNQSDLTWWLFRWLHSRLQLRLCRWSTASDSPPCMWSTNRGSHVEMSINGYVNMMAWNSPKSPKIL